MCERVRGRDERWTRGEDEEKEDGGEELEGAYAASYRLDKRPLLCPPWPPPPSPPSTPPLCIRSVPARRAHNALFCVFHVAHFHGIDVRRLTRGEGGNETRVRMTYVAMKTRWG